MNESAASIAAVAVAVITALVTIWTQRGGARAQKRTAVLEERAQGLEEFKILREAAMQDLSIVRAEVADLRKDMRDAKETLSVAFDHIQVLRPMVPVPPGPPELPELLRLRLIGGH